MDVEHCDIVLQTSVEKEAKYVPLVKDTWQTNIAKRRRTFGLDYVVVKDYMEFITPDNSVGFLQEYCQKKHLPLPVYNDVCATGNDHCREFTVSCVFENYTVEAIANTKKGAKKNAARNMIVYLRDNNYFTNSQVNVAPTVKVETVKASDEVDGPILQSLTIQPPVETVAGNPIGRLQEYCSKRHMPLPIYNEVIGESRTFKMACVINGITTYGTGAQKKLAKTAAAKAMWQAVNEKKANLEGGEENIQPVAAEALPVTKITVNIEEELLDTTSSTQEEEVPNKTPKITQEIPTGQRRSSKNEIERLRNSYHELSYTDPEKWLQTYCDSRDINISYFDEKPTGFNGKKVFSIEIPTESIDLQWEGETIETAKKECCRIAGFMLLMKNIKEYKGHLQKSPGSLKKTSGHKRGTSSPPKELQPFVHLENWLNVACQESSVPFPFIKYNLIDGFYHSTCTLFTHTTTGTGESKKIARNVAVFKMQKQLLESADINETDDDLVKSQKVVNLMVQISNQLQLERQVNLDEVVEAYKKLVLPTKSAPPSSNGLYEAEYACLHGKAVTTILNLNLAEKENCKFEYIRDLATEQKLDLKTEHFDLLRNSVYPIKNIVKNREGNYLSVITVQKPNAQKLVFMSHGSTISQSLQQAVAMALAQLKILLFRSSCEIENLIFMDSIENLIPANVNGDLPLSKWTVF